MNSSDTLIKYLKPLLILTFILPLFQGIQYVVIGSVYPLVIVSLVIGLVIFFLFSKRGGSEKILRYWSYLHIGYGAIGLTLIGFGLMAGSGLPSSIYYQFNVSYVLKMGVCIIMGVMLLKTRKAHNS